MNTVLPPVEALDLIQLTAANSVHPLPIFGDFVHCLSADETFMLHVNRAAKGVPMATNRKVRMPKDASGARIPFTQLELRRASGAIVATNNILLVVGTSAGDADFDDGSVTLTQAVTVAVPASLVDSADQSIPSGTATQILPALTTRRETFVSNPSSYAFRIGGANTVSATRGILLPAGASLILSVTGGLWAYQNSGSAQSIAANYTQ